MFVCGRASPPSVSMDPESRTNDLPFYILGTILGLASGYLDIRIGDLLLTALLVLASSMVLGILRPKKPWRWILVVAGCVPLMLFLALFLKEQPYPAQIYESFLVFLPGAAGAYGGSAGRRALTVILNKS